jgi:hypothetical protein
LLPNTAGRESTLDAFKRLTEKNPWFPLRSPDSTSAATDTDRAEATYFATKSPEYSRHAELDSPHGYKSFASEWNNEVSRRFKAWSTGDEDVIQLRLKKWEYLAEYFDKIEGHKALQAANPADDEHRLALRETMRTNRRELPANPRPFVVTPPVYRNDGITPFGAPTTLNPFIAMNAVTGGYIGATGVCNRRMVAPYEVRRPILALPPPPPRQMPVFRSRKYCVTCGCRRNQHHSTESVASSCTRAWCGRCYQLKEHHPDNAFGPKCINTVSPYCSIFVEDWYTPVSNEREIQITNKLTMASHTQVVVFNQG